MENENTKLLKFQTFVEQIARMNWAGEELEYDEHGNCIREESEISNDDNQDTVVKLITTARELIKA